MTIRFRNALIIVSYLLAGASLIIGGFAARANHTPLVVASIVGFFGGAATIIIAYFRKPDAKPAKSADGRLNGFLPDVWETRYAGGCACEVLYQTPVSGTNGRPAMLLVRMAAPSPVDVRLTPERRLDRLGKFLTIAREVQTGDAEFDRAVYVRGPSEGYAAAFLASPEARRDVLALFRLGFRIVRLTGTHLEAEWVGFKPDRNGRPRLAEESVAHLVELSRWRPVEFPLDDAKYWTGKRSGAIWIALLAFAATVVCLFFWPPLRGSEMFVAGLRDFVWNYLLFAVLSAIALRGTSTAHDHWFPLVLVGIGLVGAGTYGSMAAINGLCDPGPFEERVETIFGKREVSGKYGKTYYASVRSWDVPREQIEFSIGVDDYNRIALQQSKLRLEIGMGRLGVPWVKRQTVVP